MDGPSFNAIRWITPMVTYRRYHRKGINNLFTPLLHKDAIESNVCSHKKAVSNLFGILSKGNSWIDPGDDIDFTAVPLWVRV
jgi:hypothetical protein